MARTARSLTRCAARGIGRVAHWGNMAQHPVAFVRLSGPAGTAERVEADLVAAGFRCARLDRPGASQPWLEASEPRNDADPTGALPGHVLRRIHTALALTGDAWRIREYGTELRDH